MNNKRPVYLNLFQFSFPITAIVSILHRISGIFLFILIPLFLYSLQMMLSSEDDFESLVEYISNCNVVRLVLWFFLVMFFYHMVAGIRHLIMDFGKFENLKSARLTSIIVITISTLFAAWLGWFVWAM